MAAKRKREEVFDPNKSDPEDDDFEPGEGAPRRSQKKPRKARRASGGRKKTRYRGDDITDDEESGLEDSQAENSFSEVFDDDDEDEDDKPVNAAGRRARKAAVARKNYKEESDDPDDLDDPATDHDEDHIEESGPEPVAKKKKIICLKVPTNQSTGRQLPPPRRSTRARTQEEEEFVELTNSGRHARPSGQSRSISPEAAARNSRSSRAVKSLKQAPEPIEEATQESSARDTQPADTDQDELAADFDDATGKDDAVMEDVDEKAGENEAGEEDGLKGAEEAAADDEDEDEGPITRRTRLSRQSVSAAVAEKPHAEGMGNGRPRRLTRKSGLRKSVQEPSSDFEPGEESGGDEPLESESSAKEAPVEDDDDDGDFDSAPTRGRRTARNTKRTSAKSSRRGAESGDEVELDQDELAEELHELREDSRSRRRRRRSPSILYQEPRKKRETRRATAKPVSYFMPPLAMNNIEEDEAEDPAPTPARGGRRGARGGASQAWERPLNTTYGPFGGGGGAGSLLGGPWGTGATGGVESDSSDDEMVTRSNLAGNMGMTPTSGAPPGLTGGAGAAATAEGVGATPNVGKIKNQKALADADPLGVNMNVNFDQVGGLQAHIDKLKEMVQLPLLYPELFLKFNVTPPRGVLFHGPPGTGKTLLARALANSVSSGGKKISFYMRKGADALSKWVGEAEKQLRLLFEEARRTQPSIIFFDEIDGLAPVRSSKQEQIHASIVSTLLALMDGMDGRGQVIVIGATNRPDNIDPALRRPGRFDREFYFPLPDLEGRKSIINIHTKDWGMSEDFLNSLAERTKGYGGADLRALCTEAALNSIQRAYPQIYSSQEKLIVDSSKITIHATDFMLSIKNMIPSSERSTASSSSPLPNSIKPLLSQQFESIKGALDQLMPRKKKTTALEEAMYEQHDDGDDGFGKETLHQEFERSRVFRPRFLIYGHSGMGQAYLASAVLHYFEGVHIQTFDLPSLLADGRPMEQVIVGQFTEIKRHKPSVIFIPSVETWYATLRDTLALVTFKTMLRAIPPTDPVLLLATAECEKPDLPAELTRDFFGYSQKNQYVIERPHKNKRRDYFTPIVEYIRKKPTDFPDPANRKKRVLEELQVAPPPPQAAPTKAEMKALEKRDRQLLNVLKVQLQPIMDQINRKYKKFRQPVISSMQLQHLYNEADPNYIRPDIAEGEVRPFEIVKDKYNNDVLREAATGKTYYNLEIITIEERLSNGFYCRPKDFLFDVKTLAKDARNVGDKERTLKANELVSNVEVDVANVENSTSAVDWEALYQRQLLRTKEAAEKERKRKAMQSIVDRLQSDVGGEHDSDSQGPVMIGEPIPRARTTTARFRLMSPASNGHGGAGAAASGTGVGSGAGLGSGSGSGSHPHTNGTSAPSQQDGDVRMGGTDEETQEHGQVPRMLPPPAAAAKAESKPGEQSQPTQVSQKSAVTSVPPGVSPSAMVNDASTTKTSDPSNKSSNWSTQATNGYHQPSSPADNDNSLIPDTQPLSQNQSSGEMWPHSQAHAVAHGLLNPGAILTGSPPSSSSGAQRTPVTSKSHSHSHAPQSTQQGSDPSHEEPSQSQSQSRNSGSSSSQQQAMVAPESELRKFLTNLTEKTSGCTIEQLEQINRDLMQTLWSTRNMWNRMKVLNDLETVFNETIQDIEDLQRVHRLSQ